ncbi:DUF4407 domain-containing protein [Blastococcus sp. TF02A-26]|uniref:DUF4407 domain-containing protein n=1 Tax=Blastococcus sp. TF02A-26 TaxID=2250577 RepID=UPI000DEB3864|nr:DUF4407 domain-containing protein [Blastococcus sp. TF02A-26]RBY84312.1 hypothetical protein DQ240_14375 [Blastococcus sp. TF02A-26]
MTKRIGDFFLTVSGADREVLRQAPQERTKQVAMGAVLVSVSAIAVVSATYALHLALHLSLPFAVLGGLAWGLVILTLDRWLVVSTPRLKSTLGTLAMAVPRVMLALLIGAVVSTPLTLAVFASEIDVQVQETANERENEFTEQLAADSRYAEIPAQQQQIADLQADIADGVTAADVDQDPAVVDLQRRADEASIRYEAAKAAYLAELDGSGGTGDRGEGPVTESKRQEMEQAEAERDALAAELVTLKAQVLQQLTAEDEQNRADQQARLAALQAEVTAAQEARADAIAQHEAEVDGSDGILARLSALDRLGEDDPALHTAHLMLFAFMTAIECLPIIFKTMLMLAPPTLYERLVKLDEEQTEERIRLRLQAEYEEADAVARTGLAAAEARAARTLEAESRATGMVLEAQLDVTRQQIDRWRDEQLTPGDPRRVDDSMAGMA